MYRSVLITIPAGTTASAPLRTTVKLTKGLLYQVTIYPPPGPNWEVYTRVRYRELNLMPVDDELWIPIGVHSIEATLNWNEWDGTYELSVDCCAPDARFNHDILFTFEVHEQLSLVDIMRDFIARGFQ